MYISFVHSLCFQSLTDSKPKVVAPFELPSNYNSPTANLTNSNFNLTPTISSENIRPDAEESAEKQIDSNSGETSNSEALVFPSSK